MEVVVLQDRQDAGARLVAGDGGDVTAEPVRGRQGEVEVVAGEQVGVVVEVVEERALGVPAEDLVQIGRVAAAQEPAVRPSDDLQQGQAGDRGDAHRDVAGQVDGVGRVERLADPQHVEQMVVWQQDAAVGSLDPP